MHRTPPSTPHPNQVLSDSKMPVALKLKKSPKDLDQKEGQCGGAGAESRGQEMQGVGKSRRKQIRKGLLSPAKESGFEFKCDGKHYRAAT